MLTIRQKILRRAEAWDLGSQFDFVGLHNISKHITHLVESANALVYTAGDIHIHSKELAGPLDPGSIQQTSIEIEYQKRLLQSVTLRLASLEKRVQNVVNLVMGLHMIPHPAKELTYCL
jgi:hypothetical protein